MKISRKNIKYEKDSDWRKEEGRIKWNNIADYMTKKKRLDTAHLETEICKIKIDKKEKIIKTKIIN